MNWLAPNFLIAGAAVVLPLALHLLRRRVVRTVPFPALRFLVAARPADQRRQRIRRLIVLALRCLSLALLAAAFARPFLNEFNAGGGRASIVVIDNSFSLHAKDRWVTAQRWARDALGKPVKGDTVGLLLMNPRPTWLIAPTTDTARALEVFARLGPGWETSRAEPALRLAADVLAVAPQRERRLIFLSDSQALGWVGADFSKKLPAGVDVLFAPVPPPLERQAAVQNAGLTRSADATAVVVTVKNYTAATTRTLRVFLDNETTQPIATTSVALAKNETRSVTLPLTPTRELRYVRIELDPDDLPADDIAWAASPAADGERLLILDRVPREARADYLNTAYAALAAMPPGLRVVAPPMSAWPANAVAVLRNEASFSGAVGERLDAFLAAGGSALVFIDGSSATLAWLAAQGHAPTALVGRARVRDWVVDHPLVVPLAERGLRSLVGWEFEQGWALPAADYEPLAFWADEGIALGEMKRGAGRVLVAGFAADRRSSDWPVQSAFVPFVHRAATYLMGFGGNAREVVPRVGTALRLPEGAGRWEGLAGLTFGQVAREVNGAVTPEVPGVYAWSRPGETRRFFAVGLSPEESDLAAWAEGEPWKQLASTEKSAKPATAFAQSYSLAATEAEQQSGLWWWCFAAMALFVLTELGLANRTSR
jgi:hypothetical protein